MTLSEQLKSLVEKADEHAAVLDIIGDFIDDMPHIQKDVGEVADFLSEFVAMAPTILAALEAVEWVYPKSRYDMPAKPGNANYEYVDCLILHRGDLLFRPWNCEHLVFDSEDYDDFFCEWSEIEAYQIVQRPLGPTPENTHD